MKIGEEQLLARLRSLPRERSLAVDLWPLIEARLGQPGRSVSWLPQAAAALLVAALGLAVVRIGGDPAGSQEPRRPPVAWQVSAAGAEREYSGALQDMRGLEFLDASGIAAAARDEVAFDLRVVREATRQVRAAMEKNPDAAYLTGMLATLHRRQLGVLRNLALSTLSEASEDVNRRAS